MNAYKIYQQLEEKNKKYSNYKNYEQEDLIDIIEEKENKKEQLISFLEDKIKQSKDKICKIRETTNDGWEISILKRKIVDFQEVLDFINKGGKDE